MENQPQVPQPVLTVAPKKKSSIGGVIAIIVILGLIVLGALYAWGERVSKDANLSPEEEQILNELEVSAEVE